MDDKEKLISDLETSKSFITRSMELGKQIPELKEEEEHAELMYEAASTAAFSIGTMLINSLKFFIVTVVGLGLIEIIIEIVSRYKFMPFYDFLLNGASYILFVIVALALGGFIEKKSVDDFHSSEEDYKERWDDAILEHSRARAELKLFMESDTAKLTRALIPPDYFYPAAIEKFIYYLRNGHADNMKEAVRLYDEFLHRQIMEEEARKTTANTEAAAEAATITAQKSIELVQKQESANFWILYNACQLEDIKHKIS